MKQEETFSFLNKHDIDSIYTVLFPLYGRNTQKTDLSTTCKHAAIQEGISWIDILHQINRQQIKEYLERKNVKNPRSSLLETNEQMLHWDKLSTFRSSFHWGKCSEHLVPEWWCDPIAFVLDSEMMVQVVFLEIFRHFACWLTMVDVVMGAIIYHITQ